ncbi:MAG TPA: glucose-6-phosphate isomerase [Candidatus Limiplasma sp.]|nr:glucose-6-phosphate isomerase [Candidatus Limiplasma sp.]HPR77602.1 glucose-6-phosphate isomerase [Candidatus Limiplasma sp.]
MEKMIREPITLDVNHMMSDIVGFQYGIDFGEVESMQDAAAAAQNAVENNRGTGWLGWMQLPYNQSEIVENIEKVAAKIRNDFEAFVVLGIGGSALGPIAVHQALNHQRWNELPAEKRGGPKFYVEDNIDPERMASLLDVIDVKRTCFNVITKSGATAETMSQYLIISELLKKEVGEGWQKHIVATTDSEKGNLIKLARQEGFELFYIPDGVGGRFSELTPVGLLPAAVCGIDIRAMLEGAAAMDERCKTDNLWKNPALLNAVLQYLAMEERHENVQVVMPYADSLKYMADWFCQLWAESLGKNVTRKGMAVNCGQTPTKALGVTDQHSQLQLYTEGPYDKAITFLKVHKFQNEVVIADGCEEFADVHFLSGKTLNSLIDAELRGTEYALYRAGRMSQTITLPEVNAYTIGQLICFFEMATAYEGELLDVDAFNQPGVEGSKLASYAVLGNKSEKYLKKAEEMKGRPNLRKKYVL